MTMAKSQRPGQFGAALARTASGDPGNDREAAGTVKGIWDAKRDLAEPSLVACPNEADVLKHRSDAARGFVFAVLAGLMLWLVMLGLLAKFL